MEEPSRVVASFLALMKNAWNLNCAKVLTSGWTHTFASTEIRFARMRCGHEQFVTPCNKRMVRRHFYYAAPTKQAAGGKVEGGKIDRQKATNAMTNNTNNNNDAAVNCLNFENRKQENKGNETKTLKIVDCGKTEPHFLCYCRCQMSNVELSNEMWTFHLPPPTGNKTEHKRNCSVKKKWTVKNVTNQMKCNQTEWTGQRGDIKSSNDFYVSLHDKSAIFRTKIHINDFTYRHLNIPLILPNRCQMKQFRFAFCTYSLKMPMKILNRLKVQYNINFQIRFS